MNISILGAGAWGTALAINLAARHKVVLWAREPEVIEAANARRENTVFLPGFSLPASLSVTGDFEQAVSHCGAGKAPDSLLILATSVDGLRPVCERLQGVDGKSAGGVNNLIWLCKGFEDSSRMMPHQVVRQVLGDAVECGALSGPSFAQEVAAGLPCALAVASGSAPLRERTIAAVHGNSIRVYSTDDLVGVEAGGAVKNILAIATGIVDGMRLGLNARAALITRGLVEITRLGTALGGRVETFNGLTGMGDLILTCTGDLSRNRRVGLALAEGKSLDVIVAELGHVAEGVRCARAVRDLALQHKVEMPIAGAVAGVLFDGESPRGMVAKLLARDPRTEAS